MASNAADETTQSTAAIRDTRPHHLTLAPLTTEQPTIRGPLHRALMVVDIENSTARRDPVKAQLRRTLYRLLDEALELAGILAYHRDPLVDRGDGVLVLIHPADHLPKSCLFNVLVPAIEHLVGSHNREYPQLAFRLRIAIHAGEIHHDDQGPFGEAIDIACRLLDTAELKAALRQTRSATVLAVSDHLYDVIIRHQYDDADTVTFTPSLRVDLAGIVRRGWLRTTPRDSLRPAPFRPSEYRTGQIADGRSPGTELAFDN